MQVFLLMEGLRARGHGNFLACLPGGPLEAEARARGFDTVGIPMRNQLDLAAVRRLHRAIREARADLVHLHTGRANWLGGLAARLAGRPAVTTRRMDRRVKRGWRTRLLYGHLVERAAAISPAVLERMLAGGVPRERVRLIWSSVDPARMEPQRERAELRRELGVDGDRRVVLAVGSLIRRKGFDVLLEALGQLGHRREAALWIAGEGAERANLERRIDELDLGSRARLHGARDDVPDLLAACDLFAMPSRAEGVGVAALEAMAAGVAVVASAVGGLGEVVVEGRTGLLVPPEDPQALAEAIGALLGDDERRARLAREGPQRLAEGFLPEQMVGAYEELYREVLREGTAA